MEQIILALIDVLGSADNQRVELLQQAVKEYGIKYPRSLAVLKRQKFAGRVIDAIETADTTEQT